MARGCASWPGVLMTVWSFVLWPPMIASVFVERFSIGDKYYYGYSSSAETRVSFYLTHYWISSYGSFFSYQTCYYDGSYNFFSTASSCPNFPTAEGSAKSALAFGILGFIAQLTVFILFLVYTPVCCDGKKCGKGLMIAIIAMLSTSVGFQALSLFTSLGIRGDVEKYFSEPTRLDAGFIINLVIMILSSIFLALLIIYARCGGREKCQCCHETKNTTTTVVIAATPTPPPATTTVTTHETVVHGGQQPGYVVQQQQPQQVVYQPPMASYPPDGQPQYVAPMQTGYYNGQQQQGPPSQQYFVPQQQQQQQAPQYYQQ